MSYETILQPNFYLNYWLNNYNEWSMEDMDNYLDFIEKPIFNSLGFADIDYEQEIDYTEVMFNMLKEILKSGSTEFEDF